MTAPEFAAIVLGALGGYWVISSAISYWGRRDRPTNNGEHGRSGESRAAFWFEVLEVPPNATREEIARAYQALLRRYDPDNVASLGPEFQRLADEKLRQIKAAYTEAELIGRL